MKDLILNTRRDVFIGNLVSYMNTLSPENPLYEKARKTFAWICEDTRKRNEQRCAEQAWLLKTKEALSIN